LRLLLDAHVSGRRVGRPLAAVGHDVRPLDQEAALEALDDEEVLTLAAEDRRILVTHNVADFPAILREWAAAGRSHAGVILVYGIGHNEFGVIRRAVKRGLAQRPRQSEWIDLALVVDRAFAERRIGDT
jgi:predicted nuclease of predicted toxin-antitoxin system